MAKNWTRAQAVEAQRRYRAKHPDRARQTRRDSAYKSKYGLSVAEVADMIQAQGGLCAICGTPVVRDGRTPTSACVDHDHATGAVRAILCRACNSALGYIKDRADIADAMSAYLRGFDGKSNK